MCEFFSCIAIKDGRILFCEVDSHERIIQRAALKDDKIIDRDFVRLEIIPRDNGTWDYQVDEIRTLPTWYLDKEKSFMRRAEILAKKVQPVRTEYEKIERAAWTEYKKIKQLAQAEYDKVKYYSRTRYWKIMQPVRTEYKKIERAAWTEYISKISSIKGYVK